MKRATQVGGVLFVAVFFALLIFGMEEKSAIAPEVGDSLAGESFLVRTIKNDVSVRNASAENFETIGEEAEAEAGALVRTSETGRSIIEASNGALTVVDRNSQVTIAEHTKEGTTLKLQSGAAWSRIEKTFERGEFYEIETQDAVATVRGTEFGSEVVLGEQSVFLVASGTVTVYAKDSAGGRNLHSRRDVVAGEKATVQQGETIVVEPVSEADRASEWYRFNTLREYEASALPPASPNTSTPITPPASPPTLAPDFTPTSPTTSSPISPTTTTEDVDTSAEDEEVIVDDVDEEPTQPTPEDESTADPLPFFLGESIPNEIDPSSDELSELTFRGHGFAFVKEVYVGSLSVQYQVVDDSTLIVFVEQLNTLPAGTYDIHVGDGQDVSSVSDGLRIVYQNFTR